MFGRRRKPEGLGVLPMGSTCKKGKLVWSDEYPKGWIWRCADFRVPRRSRYRGRGKVLPRGMARPGSHCKSYKYVYSAAFGKKVKRCKSYTQPRRR